MLQYANACAQPGHQHNGANTNVGYGIKCVIHLRFSKFCICYMLAHLVSPVFYGRGFDAVLLVPDLCIFLIVLRKEPRPRLYMLLPG